MRCFPPILDCKTEVLFLGSFPGPESLRKKQYYAHPQNQFWRLVGNIVGKDLHNMDYSKKISVLRKSRIGLWDVISKCDRAGSSDTKIRNECLNDFEKIGKLAPNIKLVCFNGKTSGRFIHDLSAPKKVILPSSSPANTMGFEDKLREWKLAIGVDKS